MWELFTRLLKFFSSLLIVLPAKVLPIIREDIADVSDTECISVGDFTGIDDETFCLQLIVERMEIESAVGYRKEVMIGPCEASGSRVLKPNARIQSTSVRWFCL